MKEEQIIEALDWLVREVANLQSHFGLEKGENENMSRGEFFAANADAMREKLYKILGIKFLK